jgi:hypothetical protein
MPAILPRHVFVLHYPTFPFREYPKHAKVASMLKRLAIVGFGAIFVIGLYLGFRFARPSGTSPAQVFNTATILKQVQTLSQLVTVKYVLEKVVVLDDFKWYGENRVLIIAHGIVKAGIDLGAIQPADIQISNKRITLNLPRAAISDVYLDDRRTQVLERSTGILRVFDKDLEQNARRQALDDIRRGAFYGGILKDADERARTQLTSLLLQLGFAEVTFQQK